MRRLSATRRLGQLQAGQAQLPERLDMIRSLREDLLIGLHGTLEVSCGMEASRNAQRSLERGHAAFSGQTTTSCAGHRGLRIESSEPVVKVQRFLAGEAATAKACPLLRAEHAFAVTGSGHQVGE
jgi:hypothetical protein